jgi:phosphopantetheinyl transferase
MADSPQGPPLQARILLRLALSVTTGNRVAPRHWQFDRNKLGKPFVRDNIDGIEFSVSHADTVVMVAIGRDVNVGIDVEGLDQQLENNVADHFCHQTERQVLDRLPAARRQRVFLEFWTEKEAYTKMLGVGHSLEFQSFSVIGSRNAAEDSARLHAEEFYFSIDHSLYHAALFIDRKDIYRPLDVQLMSAELQSNAGFASLPSDYQNERKRNA